MSKPKRKAEDSASAARIKNVQALVMCAGFSNMLERRAQLRSLEQEAFLKQQFKELLTNLFDPAKKTQKLLANLDLSGMTLERLMRARPNGLC